MQERIRHWSLYQPWLQADTLTHWSEIREQGPILRSEEGGGFWILTRYEDIEWAARNPQIFSSAELGIPHRKIFPAFYNLRRAGLLPLETSIVGYSRRPFTDEAFVTEMHEAVRTHSHNPVEKALWDGAADANPADDEQSAS